MNNRSILFFLLLVFSISSYAQNDNGYKQKQILTDTLFEWIRNGQASMVVPYFSVEMQRQLSASQLDDIWNSLSLSMGEFVSAGVTEVEEKGKKLVANKPLKFEQRNLVFRVTYDSVGAIAGIFFLPANSGYQIAEYINPLAFVEYKLTFGKEPYILEGTLCVPKGTGTYPIVIIVHGSGPMDRDGSMGSNKPYKDIAWGLASKGIATFRYEKRSKTYGILMLGNKSAETMTLKEEVIDDACYAIDVVAKQKQIDPKQIWIAGHSQGGMAAPLIAKQSKKCKGIILLAANARPMQELLIEQIAYLQSLNPTPTEEEVKKNEVLLRQVRNSMQPDLPLNTPSDSLPFGTYPAYWNFLQTYNQVDVAKKLKRVEIIVLQGQRDYQVTVTDYNLWMKELGNMAYGRLFENLNHLFMPGKGQPSPQEYTKQNNVSEWVLDVMAAQIKK